MAETRDNRLTKQFRASLLYSFELLGGRHNFVAGRQELSERAISEDFPTSQSILAGDFVSAIPADGRSIRREGSILVPASWQDTDWRWYQGHYLIYQGSVWNNRLHPVLGYRWDRTQTRRMRSFFEEDGSLGDPFDPLAGRNTRDGRDNQGIPFRERTPTAGLSVAVHPAFSVYGVYSEGVALPNVAQRDGFGQGFPPEFTRNREVGMKVELWDGKLSGRVSYFNLVKTGGVRYSWYAPNPSRGNFNPAAPIVYHFPVDSAANLQRFLNFMRSTGWQGTTAAQVPADIPRLSEGSRMVFAVPFGDPNNPGAFNPATNNSDGTGYGQNLRAFFLEQEALRDEGLPHDNISVLGGNNPSMDRGAYHNFDETSEGFEVRLNFTPVPNWQNVFSYTQTKVIIRTTFANLADNQIMTGLEPIFWNLGTGNFSDPLNPNSYTGSTGAGVTNNDSPRHSFTYWSRYSFTHGPLAGFDIRFGARYQSERAAESPWASAGGGFNDAVDRGKGNTTKAPVPAYTLFDLGMGYTWDWRNTNWTVQLNVRNIFNKQELRAETTNRLVEGLPVLTLFYLEPRDVRLSLRVDF
ncbi:MAG: TonB-dependent receptor [Verrucomicrobia bacterium]|nr:TonB-dependent receptor [Verrucomicrobiota bacterium]